MYVCALSYALSKLIIMKHYHLYILLSLLVHFSCDIDNNHTTYVDPNEALLENLTEINGINHTYNYDFKFLQEREKVAYYMPLSFPDALASTPSDMKEKLNFIAASDLPFVLAQEQANIVTSWNAFNKLEFQIQFSYLENPTGYETNFKDFFIVSVTQYPNDPFADEQATIDIESNLPLSYQKLELIEGHPLYYKPVFGTWPRMFDHYSYNQEDNKMIKVSTGAYQYYTWHNGLIYRIGFKMDISATDHEALVRKIILGN